jgi:death-on-curing family protein
MHRVNYPSEEKIIEYNILVVNTIRVKKADKAEVLNFFALKSSIEECREYKGDIYDKAVFLMKSLVKRHPFASGNRRTAFVVVKDFLLGNKAVFKIKNDSKYAKVMLGMRGEYYADSEIKEWIKKGNIREFRR